MTPKFHRPTFCSDGMCVEVSTDGDTVLVRDGKAPDGPVLEFTGAEWDEFLAGVRAGEFTPEALRGAS